MSDDAIYRYFGKNPSWSGGSSDSYVHSDESNKRGGTITVMPCGVITFSGSYIPEFANYVGFIGSHDAELADVLAMDSSDEVDEANETAKVDINEDTNITDIVNSGGIMVFGAYDDSACCHNSDNSEDRNDNIDDHNDNSNDNINDNIDKNIAPFDITTI